MVKHKRQDFKGSCNRSWKIALPTATNIFYFGLFTHIWQFGGLVPSKIMMKLQKIMFHSWQYDKNSK